MDSIGLHADFRVVHADIWECLRHFSPQTCFLRGIRGCWSFRDSRRSKRPPNHGYRVPRLARHRCVQTSQLLVNEDFSSFSFRGRHERPVVPSDDTNSLPGSRRAESRLRLVCLSWCHRKRPRLYHRRSAYRSNDLALGYVDHLSHI